MTMPHPGGDFARGLGAALVITAVIVAVMAAVFGR